jgi:hypothetical protein
LLQRVAIAPEIKVRVSASCLAAEGRRLLDLGLHESTSERLAVLDLGELTTLVLGSEVGNMRRLVRERRGHLARLPTRARQSTITMSNAAAVALYELVRYAAVLEASRGHDIPFRNRTWVGAEHGGLAQWQCSGFVMRCRPSRHVPHRIVQFRKSGTSGPICRCSSPRVPPCNGKFGGKSGGKLPLAPRSRPKTSGKN